FSGLHVAAAADGRELLRQMTVAMRTLDYQGSFSYQHAGRTDTMRVFHAGGASERERLISLNGPRTEVIRDGLTITCIQPDGSATVYSSSSGRGLLPLVPSAGEGTLGEHYDVSVIGSDRVAGYTADIVDISGRDPYRYGYRLWIDQGSRLLLRSIVTDSERRPLEQLMFVSLEIGTPPRETDLLPQVREILATTVAPDTDVQLRRAPAWHAVGLPVGFALATARRQANGVKGSEHLVYTDGLASVSVYIEPRDADDAIVAALAGRGTMNVYSVVGGKWRITALGEVPARTVEAIAQSMRSAEASATE
ncbi:MAG: MucB/RseB C-terminal domain-containing protein, partial [Dokdonella sp.]